MYVPRLRIRSRWLLLILCIWHSSLASVQAAEIAGRPNIVLFVTDDQRWDALGCMGNPVIQTPRLDELAADGVRFDNCFCTTSICSTSRATILSGQYARRHGIWDFQASFTEAAFAQTFPARLREAGYRTAFIGKWGIGVNMPIEQYDDWAGFPGQGRYYKKGDDPNNEVHLTRRLGTQAVEFLESCSPDEPFIMHVAFKAAHCQDGELPQFQHDARFSDLFRDVQMPRPKTATAEHFDRLPNFLQTSEARIRWKKRFDGDAMFQETVKDYFRLIKGVDVAVGRVVDALREKGLADNTVILFTSDNGFYLGDHGLAGKWFMHEPSIRLPLIIHDPRLSKSQRGQSVSQMALTIDVAPTILALAGLENGEDGGTMQGHSLLPLIQNERVAWRKDFLYEHLFEHPAISKCDGVRTERWSYALYQSPDGPYEALYDLQADPLEEKNLAKDVEHAQTLVMLRARRLELIREAK